MSSDPTYYRLHFSSLAGMTVWFIQSGLSDFLALLFLYFVFQTIYAPCDLAILYLLSVSHSTFTLYSLCIHCLLYVCASIYILANLSSIWPFCVSTFWHQVSIFLYILHFIQTKLYLLETNVLPKKLFLYNLMKPYIICNLRNLFLLSIS